MLSIKTLHASLQIWSLAFLTCVFVFVGLPQIDAQEKGTIDFSRDIKPLLSDRCFQCHGPDENQRLAELRLDVAEAGTTSYDRSHIDGRR